MVIFALASVGNVSSYLQAHGHHWLTSYALGGVLVVTAMALADVDYEHERERFWFMVVVVVVIGLLSGTVQTWAYGSHEGMVSASARLMGYGFPIVCEGLLAVYIATYGTTRRRKNIRMATEGTAEAVASAVADALADVDVTKVRRYVERRVDGLTRAIVDGVIDDLMPVAPTIDAAPDTPNAEPQSAQTPIAAPTQSVDDADRIHKVNRQRAVNAEQRRQALLAMLADLDGAPVDELNKSEIARVLGRPRGR
ncbi:MAG: hypothetical protein K0U66_06355 [Gammaproteobacteria bacterium]|nr:hypothetical protein [Gammaproteobacteria bacterium]